MSRNPLFTISTYGCLREIIENQEGLLAKIIINNYCDEFHFDCTVNEKLQQQFHSLKTELSNGKNIILQFSARYLGIYIHNCIAEDDPERIIDFTVELDQLNTVLVDGKEWTEAVNN